MKDRIFFYYVDEAEQRGNPLGYYCSVGAAVHTHSAIDDKYNIQDHIDRCRYDQKIQRRSGIAQRPEKRRQGIIGGCNDQSGINDPHISRYIRHDIIRKIHQSEDRNISCQKSCRHQHRQYNGKVYGHCHIVAHPVIFLRSEPLGHQNSKSAAHSVHPSCDEKHQRTSAADGSQSLHAQEFTGHNRIRHIIKLLKYISQKHGNHKLYDQF